MTDLDFSDDQELALNHIEAWHARRHSTMTLGGYAGTGKTTLTAYLAKHWCRCAVAALCGKAAHVLRQKGVDAQTIHSLIYVPFENEYGQVRYRKRQWLEGVETVIIDEASMIDHLLLQDLLSFNLPVLFVGDHGQLEPIGTNPNLMKDPEVKLERIHRQAQGNPILRLAAAVREGRAVPYWESKGGEVRILRRRQFWQEIRPNVQVVCGYHRTRHEVNRRVRKLGGWGGQVPEEGERLICLQNNQQYDTFNGQQFTVRGSMGGTHRVIDLELEGEDGRGKVIPCLRRQFGADKVKDHKDHSVCLFDWAYGITCHAAQGSEWPDVLVLDECGNSWDKRRWRYTAVTRGKVNVTFCA